MLFMWTTSLGPKIIKKTVGKQVVPKQVGMRRGELEPGDWGRQGFGVSLCKQTHQLCFLTSSLLLPDALAVLLPTSENFLKAG